jgi:mRNA interferase MazF
VKQYEIWWAELPEPIGRRPVLILTRSPAVGYLSHLVVAEVTSTIRGIPIEVPLGKSEGLKACVANLDNLHSVPKGRLRARAGSLAGRRVREVKRALGYALGWAELTAL